ncbi:MAG TPA: hypothetical protein VMU32_10185, partial [Solirubrobacteraceae bacterium]|nr:hypothetical protein [Solirubrobacteraceae bacterium]
MLAVTSRTGLRQSADPGETTRWAHARGAALGSLVLTLTAILLSLAATFAASRSWAAPIALDAPDNGAAPQIAYDPKTGTTYVAWTDPQAPGVDLCVLPPTATGCEGGAPVLLLDSKYPEYEPDNAPGLGGLVVLPGGETVVIGTPVRTGSVAWASPAGGAAFLSSGQGLQNGGKFISPVSLFYATGNAVALNGSDVALLDDYGNYFSDSPLTAESPAIPTSNSNPGEQFTRKALLTDGPEIAAEPAPAPAPAGSDIVVGVGANNSSLQTTPPGCINDAATGYGVSVGTVDGTSAAAGTLNGKGIPAYQLLACSAEMPVLAQGGEDGIGVIEQEGSGISGAGSDYTLDYRPFVASAGGGTFGSPTELADVTEQSLGGVDSLDLSDDAGQGVYATWTDDQGLVLDYSHNGGGFWAGPVVVPAPASGEQSNQVIAGVGGGKAEIAYESNPGTGTQVFLEPVSYDNLYAAQYPLALTTTQTSGSTSGADIAIPAGTVGESDKAMFSGPNATSATGSVEYILYSSPTCSGAPVYTSPAGTPVTGGVAGSSGPVTAALAPGTYYWTVAYTGDSIHQPATSACGSEVLTVTPAATVSTPTSEFKVEAIVTNSNGTITITIVVEQPGEATLEVTISTTTLAQSAAVEAKSKRCKHGHVKLKGRCVSATTVVGKTSA